MRRNVSTLFLGLMLAGTALGQEQPGSRYYATPEDAFQQLVGAARTEDITEVVRVLGTGSRAVVSTGSVENDRDSLRQFTQRAAEGLSVEAEGELAVLKVGSALWPFPFPLRRQARGWCFDVTRGLQQIRLRRVGENELSSMQVCRAVAAAQRAYALRDYDGDGVTEYAAGIRSRSGGRDGLYWPGESRSPVGELLAQAEDTPNAAPPVPYHGYLFRLLPGQGTHSPGGARSYVVNGHQVAGFAVVAFPTEWGSSGVMTFILNQDGHLYERNLGPQTRELARGLTLFDPDANWRPVKE